MKGTAATMTNNETIQAGTVVQWRGAWGSHAPKLAMVERVEKLRNGATSNEDTFDVEGVDWADLVHEAGRYVFTLSNGHFAYGYQIDPEVADDAATT